MPEVSIEPALAQDREPVRRLVSESGLPVAGVAEQPAHFFVARSNGALAGAVGVEPAGAYGLLRSLAVAADFRGRGIASALCARASAHAAGQGMRALYLLTTTAPRFFAGAGFAPVRRDTVPQAIGSTAEFSSLCPQSAVAMAKALKRLNLLFLCTGNSARSILAEAYLNCAAGERFAAHSAGSHPADAVNPYALELLAGQGILADGLRSKSWNEFARAGAPRLDFVVTVCDNAAGESCPLWPGQPAREHWSIADPAAVHGSEADKRAAFAHAFADLKMRIDAFLRRT